MEEGRGEEQKLMKGTFQLRHNGDGWDRKYGEESLSQYKFKF